MQRRAALSAAAGAGWFALPAKGRECGRRPANPLGSINVKPLGVRGIALGAMSGERLHAESARGWAR